MNELVHSSILVRVTASPFVPRRADGLVTTIQGTYLGITIADCVPVIAYDPLTHVVGIAHAGWKGTVNGIAGELVRVMVQAGARARDIRVWLGPSAQSCCYELRSGDTYRENRFTKKFGGSVIITRGSKRFVDLQRSLLIDLYSSGILPSHAESSGICSIHSAHLPSHRRERATRAKTMYAFIAERGPLENLNGTNVLVMGLGVHGGGVDVVKWLVRQHARVTVTDLKTKHQLKDSIQQLQGLPVRYVLGEHRNKDIEKAELVIASPGVPRDSKYLAFAEQKGIPVENDASIFFQRCPTPIIGITGTKGKTSTSMLLLAMLTADRSDVVGVGYHQVPMMNALNDLKSSSTVVAELSSWRLERLAKHRQSPHIAVCTNVMPDHLNRYRGFPDYVRAKEIIFKFQTPDDVAILNKDNAVTRKFGATVRGSRWWFSLRPFKDENGMFVKNGRLVMRTYGKESVVAAVPKALASSPHMLSNVLAAALTARLSGVSLHAIKSVIHNMPIIPHRLESVRTLSGVLYVNDSAATTPEAATAALEAISGPVVIIAGGTDKGLQFGNFANAMRKKCKAIVLLDGTATKKIKRQLPATMRIPVVQTMRDAVTRARAFAEPGDTVLLSPGAASFELFAHEFDRGDQFRSIVTALRA